MILKFMLALLFTAFLYPADYRDFINEGDLLYNNFDNFNALKEYEKAYKLAPDNYDVLFRLVRTYNDAGEELKELRRRDEAESYINKAMTYAEIFHQKYPDSAAAYTYLAMSYGNVAMYKGGKDKVSYAKKIEQAAKKAISISQTDHMPYIILGIYYRELASLSWLERTFANAFFGGVPEGSLEDSEKMFKNALAINQGIVVAVYQLSKTYREMNRKKDEEALLTKVLTMQELNFRDKFAKEKSKRRLEQI
jgi:tetratricopeptide (TPR) repeat protein